ncbi:predicted protein [Naegleria gruberi]|uniref:Predicted protein n=1 Tax=Naegleria gruberi TaxID=5762 RepID=D2VVJ8_NAEGR|nr:uncharacterized protein NAEGRDRAFT_73044 [Naegleria gruberi]EFC39125.1 predicted protein [Naegleria gruberi]|eukprot:XP_002671869.1 predicted protein [Naegleria gruberi strain NEG-M]
MLHIQHYPIDVYIEAKCLINRTRANRQRYSVDPETSKHAKAKVEGVRVHFKNTCETINAIKGLSLRRAKKYLHNVLRHTEAIPFKIYNGGPGRHAHSKEFGVANSRYPTKSIFAVLKLLKNAENNARVKGLNVRDLVISHSQANRAPKMRRRTFRAHGRINPFMANPTHMEIILTEKKTAVAKAQAAVAQE